MRINTNINALNAYNELNNINRQMGIVQQRLASGKRINSAADDPAGYTLSRKLAARSRSLAQASSNVGELKNLLSVAEGGLATINDLYVSIEAKMVQAANGSYTSDELDAIATQINDMLDEVDDIIDSTTFNESQLLDNNFTGKAFQVGPSAGEALSVTLDANIDSSTLGLTGITSASTFTNYLTSIDNAISTVSIELQYVGSLVNRLDIKETNLQTSMINTDAARSRIEDADMAREQLEATRLEILQNSAITQLAQANTSAQSVLQLFQ